MNSLKSAMSSLTDQFTRPKNSPRDKNNEVSPLTPNTPDQQEKQVEKIIIPNIARPPPPTGPPPQITRPQQRRSIPQYQSQQSTPMSQYQSQQIIPMSQYQPPVPSGLRPNKNRPTIYEQQYKGGKTRKRKIKKRKTKKRKRRKSIKNKKLRR